MSKQPENQQQPVDPAKREAKPKDDVQSNPKASVNPFANTGNKSEQLQNPSRNQASGSAPMGHDAGKNPGKVTPIRNNPQNNNPMSVDKPSTKTKGE